MSPHVQPSNPELAALFDAARKLSSEAGALALAHRNESVRVSGAKLRESSVLLFTAESAPMMPGRKHTWVQKNVCMVQTVQKNVRMVGGTEDYVRLGVTSCIPPSCLP